MKNLNDFKEEIYKCSRCGLCQTVCPVYKVTLNECSVSRTKFNMLNGIVKGDLALNKKIMEYMDLCLSCDACKNFCPSDINVCEIFTAVKMQYNRNKKRLISPYFIFKSLLFAAKTGLFLYRLFWMDKLTQRILRGAKGLLCKRVLLFNSLAQQKIQAKTTQNAPIEKTKKAVYFKGCFNTYINADSEHAVKKIFANTDIELVERPFECCGISLLSSGFEKEFLQIAKKNLSLIPKDCDYILTDCASCSFVLKSYEKYLPSDITEKVVSVLDLLKNRKISVIGENIKITAHKPCHEDSDFISLIKNIDGIDYIEAENFDKCCGFSGKFALNHQNISREISKRKAIDFLNTGAEFILTNCPACKLGINQGLIELGNQQPEVMNVIEFIAKYCIVE